MLGLVLIGHYASSLIISGADIYCIEDLCLKCAFLGQFTEESVQMRLYSPLARDGGTLVLYHHVITYHIISDLHMGIRDRGQGFGMLHYTNKSMWTPARVKHLIF
jgi:hypothetical protein